MRALVIDAPGRMRLCEVSAPAYDGECLVRVRRAGICGTDLEILQGYADFQGIPGHEFVGEVEAVSAAADASWIGRRVVAEINVGCGRCTWCAAGQKEHCPQRRVVGIRGRSGAFAELVVVPATNLHEIPASIDNDAAVFVEPTAAACRILDQIPIERSSRIAVLGDGRMGLLVGQVLRTAAADVVVLGRHEEKLEIARSLGVSASHAEDQIDRFDIVVEVTGRQEGITRALELVRPRGTVVLKSTFHGEAPLASWPIVVNEVALVGSRCGPFRRAIELLASGAVRTRPLVSASFPLEEWEAAFASASRGLKVIFLTEAGPGRASGL